MGTKPQAVPQKTTPQDSSESKHLLILFAGWAVPGAGHMMQRYWLRGALLFVSVASMFAIGLAIGGKIYHPNTGDLLEMLGFIGDLGSGGLYWLARLADWGAAPVQVTVADYGTKFIVVAGLLNVISAVDAYSLANGRKR
jgi:hypothetical protein